MHAGFSSVKTLRHPTVASPKSTAIGENYARFIAANDELTLKGEQLTAELAAFRTNQTHRSQIHRLGRKLLWPPFYYRSL